MRMRWLTTLLFASSIVIGMAGCGSGDEFLAAVQISPAGGTATAAAANDTVQFTAIGWYAPLGSCGLGGCGLGSPDKHQTLANANWKTSDSVNTSVNSKGLATCLSSTSSPATITATASGGLYGPTSGTATMICN